MTARWTTQRTCPHCQAYVLTGLDADTAGIPVTVDREPVDSLGEALAVLQGRQTYERRNGSYTEGRGGRLEQRTASSIRRRVGVHPVHAEHRCHEPLPTAPAAGDGWGTASWEDSA